MAESQAALGYNVHATSLVRLPEPARNAGGVSVHPLTARNPLWIQDSARYPAPVRLANKAATIVNRRVSSEFGSVLDDIRPDVLHTHSMVELPPTVWDQAARRGVPIVHTLHDYDLLCIRGALFKNGRKCQPRHAACRILSAPKRASHGKIAAVAAVSQAVLDAHLDHGLFAHLPPERRRILWNPASIKRPNSDRRVRAPDAPLCFGFLGRLTAEKGLGPILQACRRLPATGWMLSIAGEGSERATFEQQATGLPVSFEGYVDAANFLAGIDVLICAPVWDEPFGLTTIEAYAAGCRVIGSDRGVIGEVVSQVDPGWTVPAGDVEALVAAMTRAIGTGSALPAESQSAVDILLGRLDPDVVARAYLDLYQMVLPAAQAPLTING